MKFAHRLVYFLRFSFFFSYLIRLVPTIVARQFVLAGKRERLTLSVHSCDFTLILIAFYDYLSSLSSICKY